MNNNSMLLRCVVENTKTELNRSDYRELNTEDEVLEFAILSETDPQRIEDRPAISNYQKEIFDELFLDIRFYFKQWLNVERIRDLTGVDKSDIIIKKIDRLVSALDRNIRRIPAFREVLQKKMRSEELEDIRTAAFVLSSIQQKISDSDDLNDVCSAFVSSSHEYESAFREALTYGLHPGINSKLKLLASVSEPGIADRCRRIISNRKNKETS